jgi:hypothetical protein
MISLEKSVNGILLIQILFLFFSSNSMAQGRYGLELSETSIVSLSSKKGYLYAGIDNYLMLDSSLVNNSIFTALGTSNGQVFMDTNNVGLIIPEKAGKLRLSLICTDGSDTVLNGYKYFHVKDIPDPQLTLDSIPIPSNAAIKKNVLLSCDSLGIYFSDDIIGSSHWMIITGFILGYNYGGFYVSHINPTNKLSKETKELINRIGSEEEISIRTTIEYECKIKKELPIYRIQIY